MSKVPKDWALTISQVAGGRFLLSPPIGKDGRGVQDLRAQSASSPHHRETERSADQRRSRRHDEARGAMRALWGERRMNVMEDPQHGWRVDSVSAQEQRLSLPRRGIDLADRGLAERARR